MGRILISEEEKQRILGMHVEKGYSSLVSEQGLKEKSTGLNASEAKAVKIIQDKIEKGEQKPVVILPENPTIAYQYPYDVKPGDGPYWANGLFVYAAFPGKVANQQMPGSKMVPPYAGQIKTVSMGTNNTWTYENYSVTPPNPGDITNMEFVVGKQNFATMIKAAFNKLDENSKNTIKRYVANEKGFPPTYKQIIANA